MKRNVILVGVLACLLFSGVWTNNLYQNSSVAIATDSGKKISEDDLIKNTHMLTKKIKNKLKEKNIEVESLGIRYGVDKEIHVSVSTQDYLVKYNRDIREIVHESAQETIFNDYPIAVSKQIIIPSDINKETRLMNNLTMMISENLKAKGYKEFENILTEKLAKKLIVSTNTSLQKNDPTSINRGKEIEKEIIHYLNNSEVMSELKTKNQILEIEVIVYNIDREEID